MKKYFLFSFLFIVSNVFSQTEANNKKLDSFFTILQQKNKASGCVALSKNGNDFYAKAIGFIDSNKTSKANLETKYRIGSITKTFTAVLVFQLIEEKKLTLETKLSKYFSQIPNANKITVGNLLHHNSGLFNITNDSTYFDWSINTQTKEQMVKRIAAYPVDFEPNAKVEYSNSNYILLTYIIENITKKSYSKNIEERIANKIGLKNTRVGSVIDNTKNEAISFDFEEKDFKTFPIQTDMSVPVGAGAIIATATDLNKFIFNLFSYKLVSKKSVDQMSAVTDGLGYGLFKFPFSKKTFYGHNGGIDGFNSIVGFCKEDGIAVTYLSNGINYPKNSILIGVLSIAYNEKFILPTFEEKPADIDLTKVVGTYATKQMPLKITITTDGKTLMAQASGQSSFPLEYKGNGIFVFDAAAIEVQFDIEKNEMKFKQGAGNFVFVKEK